MVELAAFGFAVALLLAAGIVIGMLVAPALTRWMDRADADDEGDDARRR